MCKIVVFFHDLAFKYHFFKRKLNNGKQLFYKYDLAGFEILHIVLT